MSLPNPIIQPKPLFPLAEVIDIGISKKASKLRQPLFVAEPLSDSVEDLFRLTGSIDRAGYGPLAKGNLNDYDHPWRYSVESTRELFPIDHWTALVRMFPKGTVTLRPTVIEVLRIIANNSATIRTMLKGRHRLVFLGDTGASGNQYAGIVSLERGYFCFDRVRVAKDLLWGPKDLFIIRMPLDRLPSQ